MKISFQTPEAEKQENTRNVQSARAHRQERNKGESSAARAYNAVLFAGQENGWLQGLAKGKQEKGKSLVELQQEAGNIDTAVRQDYMTVMANTMSETDFSKMEEEGYDFASMAPEEAVNIVDKIKAELARSGQYIAGYTDNMDMDTLAAALGSDSLARAISDSFQSANVPLTQENLTEVKRAWDMASQLEEPGDGGTHYMIDNQAEPEIWDFYLAQSSGAEGQTGASPRYYAEDIQGYYTQSAAGSAGDAAGSAAREAGNGSASAIQEQIDKIIVSADLEPEEGREAAKWLMEQGLPLTKENLLLLKELQKVSFPVTENVFAEAVAAAILEGKSPIHANLADGEGIYRKAASLAEDFWKKATALWEDGDITARRQLEEIRLRMTAEVNVKLLKSGFSIDTAPMEELLEALKQVENELAQSYFPEDAAAMEKYEQYRQVNRTVEEIPALPIKLLGTFSLRRGDENSTLALFHEEGRRLQEDYERAQESYEALMTAPRRDMGDSIRKAFSNVDDILEDLGYAASEENRRAARILGYNSMEMTVENIERVRLADARVRSVISSMTPGATLRMIRDGVNPLELSFEELEVYFDSQEQEYQESAESYSRFLYQLEQNDGITQKEREAYVGIYRLLRQLEKSDGAAVGAVVNTGAELQFANLLSAVRSQKFHHMDVRVTEETGLTQELIKRGSSISEQINDNIADVAREIVTEVSSNRLIERQYRRMELEQIRMAARALPESSRLLAGNGIVVNADNLLAAEALVRNTINPYKKLRERVEKMKPAGEETSPRVMELFNSEEALDLPKEESDFVSNYRDTLKEMKEAVEQLTLEASDTCVDVKEMQLIHKQLTIMTAMSDTKEYILPMYIGEELGRVHLTLTRGAREKGAIEIQVDWSESAHVEAHLQVNDRKITGFLVGKTDGEVTKLERAADIFHELLKEGDFKDWEQTKLPVVSSATPLRNTASAKHGGTADTTELYQVARMLLRAIRE